MSTDPRVWGPSTWKLIHTTALSYSDCPTDEDKKNMKNFFVYLGRSLPCMKCRNNFSKHLKTHPITDKVLSSRQNLFNWTVDIHNEVNKIHRKKIWTYEETLPLYVKSVSDADYRRNQIITGLFIVLIILVAMFFRFDGSPRRPTVFNRR